MKKKTSILIVVLLVIMLLAGCSNSTNTDNNVQANNDTQHENEQVEQDSSEESQPDNQENDDVTADDSNNETVIEDIYKYLSDTEYSLDLNKDGQEDKVLFLNNYDEMNITINGVSFELSDHYPDMTYNKFRVVDIDTSDNSVEIVLKEADPPFNNLLSFYRYDGENFYSVGTVELGFLNEKQNETIIDGSGEISVANYSNIMQNGLYYKKYIIGETGNLEEVLPENIYTYTSPITSKVNKEIKGYNYKTTEQSYMEIAPGEEIVINGEIDNWLNIKWKDNELWINGDEITHFSSDPEEKFEFDGIKFWS